MAAPKSAARGRSSVSPAQLRNKGVPITVNKLDDQGHPVTDDKTRPVTEEKHLKFTTSMLMELEEEFDGLANFASGLFSKPVTSAVRVLQVCFDEPRPHAINRLVDGQPMGYLGPILAAFELANGGDPTKVAELVNQDRADGLATLISFLRAGGAPQSQNGNGSTGPGGLNGGLSPAAPSTSTST